MLTEEYKNSVLVGLVQILVILDGTNGGEIFKIFASVSMAIYTIEMTQLEDSCNLVALQTGFSKLFCKNDAITKYEVVQSSNSPSFKIFQYYNHVNVDLTNYTTFFFQINECEE